jgi:hypothetical protein
MTLILALRYFYRFLPILTEFSVREQRLAELAEVVDLRRARRPYAHRGGHRSCAEHGDSGRSKHPRCLGQAAARCYKVIDQNRRTGRDLAPQPESACQVLMTRYGTQSGLIGDPPCLGEG